MEGVGTRRLLTLTLLFVVSCGGAAATESPTKTAHEASDAEPESSSDGEAESEAPPPKKAAACDDGTCSPCGPGMCPTGWYCDESAPGGAACGWLPECAKKSSCGCLTAKLGSSCKCSEQAGGLHLSCQ